MKRDAFATRPKFRRSGTAAMEGREDVPGKRAVGRREGLSPGGRGRRKGGEPRESSRDEIKFFIKKGSRILELGSNSGRGFLSKWIHVRKH